MNPTGHDLADMLFTGAILVLHLAALAGLGYLLGRLRGDRRARTAETPAAMWELHAGDALRRALVSVSKNTMPVELFTHRTIDDALSAVPDEEFYKEGKQ